MNLGSSIALLICLVQLTTSQINVSTCGSSKMCLSKPAQCTVGRDCAYALTYQADANKVYFEIYGQVLAPTSVYIAVGFSTDQQMGKDAVILCADLTGNGTFQGYLAYNPSKSNKRVTLPRDVESAMIKTVRSQYSNGYLYCLIERTIAPVNGVDGTQVFDLNTPYYILMASGAVVEQQTKIHNLESSNPLFPYVSPGRVNLVQMRSTRAESDILSGYQMSG